MNKRKIIDIKGDKDINGIRAFIIKKALQNKVLKKIIEEINNSSSVKNNESNKKQHKSK